MRVMVPRSVRFPIMYLRTGLPSQFCSLIRTQAQARVDPLWSPLVRKMARCSRFGFGFEAENLEDPYFTDAISMQDAHGHKRLVVHLRAIVHEAKQL